MRVSFVTVMAAMLVIGCGTTQRPVRNAVSLPPVDAPPPLGAMETVWKAEPGERIVEIRAEHDLSWLVSNDETQRSRVLGCRDDSCSPHQLWAGDYSEAFAVDGEVVIVVPHARVDGRLTEAQQLIEAGATNRILSDGLFRTVCGHPALFATETAVLWTACMPEDDRAGLVATPRASGSERNLLQRTYAQRVRLLDRGGQREVALCHGVFAEIPGKIETIEVGASTNESTVLQTVGSCAFDIRGPHMAWVDEGGAVARSSTAPFATPAFAWKPDEGEIDAIALTETRTAVRIDMGSRGLLIALDESGRVVDETKLGHASGPLTAGATAVYFGDGGSLRRWMLR